MYKIVRVNPLKYKEEIEHCQRICLPSDKLYAVEKGEWWIAYAENGSIAGFACLAPSFRYQNAGYLARAGVMPGHRGKGLQRKLIRVRLARAKKLGHKYVFSDTFKNPWCDNNLYACGMRAYMPKTPWAYSAGTYWRKKLG